MTEEFAIYRDYQKAMQYANEQRVNQFSRQYDADDLEGFKVLFPVPEPEELEEVINDDFIEAVKCYDNPDTQRQLYELERFGYFYK